MPGFRGLRMTKSVPYFPLYAANFIASKPYRLMTLQQRGLWITLYMEFWVNGSLPADLDCLSKLLGFSSSEVSNAMSDLHKSFFEEINGELVSNELEEYRQEFLERREKQRLGGLLGAQNKKAKNRKSEKSSPIGQPYGSLNYVKSDLVNSNQLTKEVSSLSNHSEWLKEFEKDSNGLEIDYLHASKGA
jgi:uncharacterized protein YdaU (DUF1376 family)